LLPANIAEAGGESILPVTNWALFMVLYRTAYTLGIEPFSLAMLHSKKCATNLYDYQLFCNFGSFILLSVIVFADLFKMLMIP
jgi:hypothetical protein